MLCHNCGADLREDHRLVNEDIPAIRNGSRMIHPRCAACHAPLTPTAADLYALLSPTHKVVLLSGAVGSGKSTIGQYIEAHYGYVFVDGDAVSKRVNYLARSRPEIPRLDVKRDEYLYHTATLDTLLTLLALQYDVVVGHIFNPAEYWRYSECLAPYGIVPILRVLVPEKRVCIARDISRACWTAGEAFVNRWYDEQRAYLVSDAAVCIDNSEETVEETVERHFAPWL